MKLLNSNLQLSTLKLIKSQWAGFFITLGSFLMYHIWCTSMSWVHWLIMVLSWCSSMRWVHFLMVHIWCTSMTWVHFSWFIFDILQWLGFHWLIMVLSWCSWMSWVHFSWFIFDVLQWLGFIAQGPQVLLSVFLGAKKRVVLKVHRFILGKIAPNGHFMRKQNF
jgi:hypothetical protein